MVQHLLGGKCTRKFQSRADKDTNKGENNNTDTGLGSLEVEKTSDITSTLRIISRIQSIRSVY